MAGGTHAQLKCTDVRSPLKASQTQKCPVEVCAASIRSRIARGPASTTFERTAVTVPVDAPAPSFGPLRASRLRVGFEPCEHADAGSQLEAETIQPSRGQQTHRLSRTTAALRSKQQSSNRDHCPPRPYPQRSCTQFHVSRTGSPSLAQRHAGRSQMSD